MSEPLHQSATFGDLFARTVVRYTTREALVADGKRWSYAELGARVAAMGAVLRQEGLKPGDTAAILAHNRADALVFYLAAMIEGLRLTPLAALSSVADQIFILNDAAIQALVIDQSFAERIEQLRAEARFLRHVFTLGGSGPSDLSARTDAMPAEPLVPKRSVSDVTMLFYTGGTTGQPKGVAHTHNSAMATVMMATSEWDWPAEMRVLVTTPVSHAAGAFAWPTFLKGGTFHILNGFAPETFSDYVAREQITATFLVPTAIYRLLDAPGLDDAKLRTLKTVIYGAAPIAPTRLAEGIRRFGSIFMQLFGQTEAPNLITYLGKSEHRLDDPESLSSCGVPLGAVQLELLDDRCEPVADGEIGEICVRGAFVMKGYWNRPTETAQAFEGGWLHTGDMGRFDGKGRLHIVDRKKDMIISGGFNVYPSEIEAVLSAHPAIASCAVVGVPDATWGEAVTAVVVVKLGQTIDKEALRLLVREKKGAVHAPKLIVEVGALPLTAVGKIDKKAIRASLTAEK